MNKKYSIGIDLGGTNLRAALINSQWKIKERIALATSGIREEALKQIEEVIEKLKKKEGDILGIGIGSPGNIDVAEGIIYDAPNIKGWNDVPLKSYVEGKAGLPAFIDNDANVMALAESRLGAGVGAKNIVCLTLGTGVGGALIVNGKLYHGAALTAAEIGHIPVNMNGPLCNCGGRGCLERYVGNRFIVERAVERIEREGGSLIVGLVGGDLGKVTPEIISQAALKGDKLSVEIWNEVGRYIGVAIAGLANLLNPEIVIIGGGVANADFLVFDEIKATIKKRAMRMPAKMVRVVPAKLGGDAGMIGAGILVWEKMVDRL
ncbi:MAG: Glucokinase [Syntrophomonadaceae bacterium]|nr:Glucokinase [Bacillota bacterium]